MKYRVDSAESENEDSCLKRVKSGNKSFDDFIDQMENCSFEDLALWVVTSSKKKQESNE